MNEPAKFATILGLDIYLYGACIAVAAAFGCLLWLHLWNQKHHDAKQGINFAILAMISCVLFARIGFCAIRARFIAVDYVPGFIYQFQLGGYSLAGACVGLLLAAGLFRLKTGTSIAETMDSVVPAVLLTLAGARLAEYFTLEGIGSYIETEVLQWFPLAVWDTYGDAVFAVFIWEALAALLLCGGLLHWSKKAEHTRGDVALTGMLLFGLTQIVLESLRQDNYLRFGFVRVNQLLGIVLVLFAIVVWLVRLKPTRILRVSIYTGAVLCTALLVLVEFGLDKSRLSNILLYIVMVVDLAVLGTIGVTLRNRSGKEAVARANG